MTLSFGDQVNMQFTTKHFFRSLTLALLMAVTSNMVYAAPATYTEDQFLDQFSGKSKKVVMAKLGNPFKKELSVKPSGASGMLGKMTAEEKTSKPVKVEMWYYKNIVKYDPKHTYKETEITFVNDRVMNVAFFNNR
jgi:hypothetical protein